MEGVSISTQARWRILKVGALFAALAIGVGPLAAGAAQQGASSQEQGAGENESAERPLPEVVVILHSGQRIRGTLVEDDGLRVTVRIRKVDTRIPKESVRRIVPQRSARDRYLEMRAMIDDSDVDRLLTLAEWLRREELLDEALKELNHILTLEPRNGDALALRRIVERQLELRERRNRVEREQAPLSPARDAADLPARPKPGEFPLLSEEQINLLKVYEVDLDDPPRLLIERRVVERFLDEYAQEPGIPSTRAGRDAFMRRPPHEILEEMFRRRAREFYGEVRVRGLPDALRAFRDHVNRTWLINSCATTRCHGGMEAGELLLYNRRPSSEQAALTNFFILNERATSDDRPLIDWARPEDSPLLQMGLQRSDAATPHPVVRGWTPVFRSVEDRRFEQAVEWIRAMHRPRPEYVGIDYEPPAPATLSAEEKRAAEERSGPDR